MSKTSQAMAEAAVELTHELRTLTFAAPVACVYNPLEYAWESYRTYLDRYATGSKRVLFLGMNPGPWGMAQTGIPFGEIASVRDWLKISKPIGKPVPEHPKRPILGMECSRSEVSGRRLWGLFSSRNHSASDFFRDQFVANYCPLVFMDSGARNLTPDKLPIAEWGALRAACDRHLQKTLALLRPEFLVGVGQFAEQCLRRVAENASLSNVRILRILHPSPASPAANRGWAEAAEKVLVENGVWSKNKR